MTEQALIALANTVAALDLPALFVLVLFMGYKQVWVWGHQLKAMTADRDYWRAAADRTTTRLEQKGGN